VDGTQEILGWERIKFGANGGLHALESASGRWGDNEVKRAKREEREEKEKEEEEEVAHLTRELTSHINLSSVTSHAN
jgi:hypothetical protein